MNDLMALGPMASPRTWHQLGILLLDGSGSMKREGKGGRPLASDVNQAVKDFLGFFKGSSKANNFSVAVITFGEVAEEHTPSTPLAQVDEDADYNPLLSHGDTTNIGAALEKAEKIALAHLAQPEAQGGVPHTAHIVILTDGLCLHPDYTRQVAERLRSQAGVELFGTLFTPRDVLRPTAPQEAAAAKELMRDVVGDDNRYKTTYDEAGLRDFFKKSMSANVALATRTITDL